MTITPLHIEIMLHYNLGVSDYRDGDFSAPAVNEFINELRANGLLVCAGHHDETKQFQITLKGIAWIDGLCKTPMPVQKWMMP